jgi:hypothetical protein
MWCYSKHLLIINYLDIINSAHVLVFIYIISFIIKLYLILLINI